MTALVWSVAAGWVVLAVGLAILVGRGIRLRDTELAVCGTCKERHDDCPERAR